MKPCGGPGARRYRLQAAARSVSPLPPANPATMPPGSHRRQRRRRLGLAPTPPAAAAAAALGGRLARFARVARCARFAAGRAGAASGASLPGGCRPGAAAACPFFLLLIRIVHLEIVLLVLRIHLQHARTSITPAAYVLQQHGCGPRQGRRRRANSRTTQQTIQQPASAPQSPLPCSQPDRTSLQTCHTNHPSAGRPPAPQTPRRQRPARHHR